MNEHGCFDLVKQLYDLRQVVLKYYSADVKSPAIFQLHPNPIIAGSVLIFKRGPQKFYNRNLQFDYELVLQICFTITINVL